MITDSNFLDAISTERFKLILFTYTVVCPAPAAVVRIRLLTEPFGPVFYLRLHCVSLFDIKINELYKIYASL